MLRKAVLALPVVALAGCEHEPSAAELHIQSACSGGDTQACIALEQIEAQRKANAIAAWQASQGFQSRRPRQTSCLDLGGGYVSCNTY